MTTQGTDIQCGAPLPELPRTHPVFAAVADARGERAIVLFFLRAFT
jgi:hypothetical protein